MTVPTWKNATTLDLVLINMYDYFSKPQAYPPFGLSDHSTIMVTLVDERHSINTRKVIETHDKGESCKAALGRYQNDIDRSLLCSPLKRCQEIWVMFQEVVPLGLNVLVPVKQVHICSANAPWMSSRVKTLS